MDSRINKIRRKIRALRAQMREVERAMRADIAGGRDCTAAAQSLMTQRREMARLSGERTALGDTMPLVLDPQSLMF